MKFELIWRWLVTDVDTLTLLCFSLFIRSNKPCPRLTLRIMFLKNTTIFDSIIPNTMYRSRKTENLSHKKYSCCCFSFFFSIRLLSVLRGHSVFSSPPQRPMTSDFIGFSIPDCIHYFYFPILILEKEPVFPFLMLSAKQENHWYHFYNVFGMTGDWSRDFLHSKPALYH